VIASLFWKEYREHRSVWIAMTVLTVASLAIAKAALLPMGYQAASNTGEGVVVVGLILTVMYGLVCGAMMFAGERETRGMTFLDQLPLGRGELWWVKFFIGLAFVLLFCGVVLVAGVALGLVGPSAVPVAWIPVLPLVALQAYVWGLCASTFCRTVLTAVTVALLVPLPVLWVMSGMCIIAMGPAEAGQEGLPVVFIFDGLVTLFAMGISLATFVNRDFEKRFALKPAASRYGTVAPRRQPRRALVLVWLALRQGGLLAGVMAVLGFFLGLALPTAGAGLWPAATLFLGVVCGIAVFAGEQADGAFKFWGDQRLPVGWLWLRRSAIWAGVGTGVAALMLLAALIHVAADERSLPDNPAVLLDKLLGVDPRELGPSGPLVFLLLWPAHGFALGQLCALVWRKSAVALVVAVMTAAGTACVWLPSLLGGGLHLVQVLGVPLLLLAACRLALWPWVTDRLRSRPAVIRLAGGVVLSSLWVLGNFGFRIVEAPGGGQPFNLAARQASLAKPEQNRPGQKIREAIRESLNREQDRGANAAAQARLGPPPPTFRDQVPQVIDQGWAAATPELQIWLETMAAEPWPTHLAEGARMSPGVFINPRDEASGPGDATDCRRAAELLTARALQIQANGEHQKSLDYLMTVLALSRHLRHQGPAYAYLAGVEAEYAGLAGLDHWLNRLGRRPELLRHALEELRAHESAVAPVTEVLAAEYLRFRTSLGSGQPYSGRHGNAEMEAMLMQVPWEAERARRLTDAVFAGRRRLAEAGELVPLEDDSALADWLPDSCCTSRRQLQRLLDTSCLAGSIPATVTVQRAAQLGLCRVRAARLQLALALYQCEHGQAATALDDLVSGLILKDLPDDPFTGRPFRYRVSQGERITWHRWLPGGGESFVTVVPAGQGILWSAGPDGTDDGGTRQWGDPKKSATGRDLIFLVP